MTSIDPRAVALTAFVLLAVRTSPASATPAPRPACSPQATSMYIESCNLGCSGGVGGAMVSCSLVTISVDFEIRVRFARPVQPSTLSWNTFQIIDVNSGLVPIGTRFVDPSDTQVVVFRPSFDIDAAGNPQFGFAPNTTYQIRVPGTAQLDPPPYITSTDATPLDNESRMLCTVVTTSGFSSPGTPYCAGDGIDPAVTTPCPCGNTGSAGRGCSHSQPSNAGARLFALGEVSPDTVTLCSTSEPPSALSVFLQGTASTGTGVLFGDGIRCASGTLKRLRIENASGGIAVFPSSGELSITSQSAALGDPIAPGSTRYYQTYYRDPNPSFCPDPPGNTWNATNGVRLTW